MPINALNRTMTMQPSMNVDELLNSQKTDAAKKLENPSEVGKADKTGAKAELEEVVHDDTSLNGQTAENFVKNNKVESGGKPPRFHSKWAANQAKQLESKKQLLAKLQEQQKANILKEWTFVDKPIDKNGAAVDIDYETKVELDDLEKQVNAEKAKAKEGHYEWQYVEVDRDSGKVGSISADLTSLLEEKVEENKGKVENKSEGVKSDEVSNPEGAKVEGQAKPEEGAKTEEKTKTKEGAKTEGKDKTDKADKTEKKDGAEKAEGEKKAEAAEKKDGDIKVWFDKHPRFKLAMIILEQVLDAVIGVMAGIASKLPDGVGGCITGGLSIIKGLAGFHKLDSIEKDLSKVIEDVKTGGEQIAGGIEKLISDPNPPTKDPNKGNKTTPELGIAAKIIGCVGTMCGELSGAKSWEDVLNSVGKSASDIVSAANPASAQVADAVKSNMSNFTKAIFRGIEEVKTAVNNSDATNDGKTTKALEMFAKILADDKSLSEDEKKLVKALSEGAINSIKAKGSKKTLGAYEDTLGAVASAVLKGRNKEIAEQTLALMKEVRAEEDPFKAAMHVIDKAKAIAGFESKELDELKKTVADAGKTVEKAGDPDASESSVQTDVGSFQDRLKNLEKLMKG